MSITSVRHLRCCAKQDLHPAGASEALRRPLTSWLKFEYAYSDDTLYVASIYIVVRSIAKHYRLRGLGGRVEQP